MKKNLLIIFFGAFSLAIFAQDWEAVGEATNGPIKAMIEFNGDLIVGGDFTMVGDELAYGVARWDGSEWHSMGTGFAGEVYDLAVYGDWLYACGWFFSDPDNLYEYEGIARWTGNAWSPVIDYDPDSWGAEVYDMLVYNNELYITNHAMIGFDQYTRVSKFNGVEWVDLPGYFTAGDDQGRIFTLDIYNNQIVAGGWFDEIDGESAKSVAIYNGSAWESMGIESNGPNDRVNKLLQVGDDLYAGGIFFDPFYTTIQKYDGNSWSIFQMDVDANLWEVQDLLIYSDELFVSGVFYYYDGPALVAACTILKESEEDYSWLDLNFFNSNSDQWIGYSMINYNGDLYLGGDFQFAGTDDLPKNNIARFNGQIPTAIEEVNNTQLVQISPNPSSDLIHFGVDLSQEQNIVVQLFDLSGRLVLEQKLQNNQLDIHQLENGVYQIKIFGNQSEYSARFMKAD